MSDLFRGRASTWSAGAGAAQTPSDHQDNDPDSDAPGRLGFDYSDCVASASATASAAAAAAAALALHSATASCSPDERQPNGASSGTTGGFLYSPPELSSQEFSNTSRRLPVVDKTAQETSSDYAQNFFTSSSPPRGSRDWNSASGNGAGGGFASSNFSVLSVAASSSSPFGHHADTGGNSGGGNGGGNGLLTPYGNSSPYANGSCSQQQQTQPPGLHSGSPSSVGSHLSSMMGAQSGALNAPPTTTTTPTTPSGGLPTGNGGSSGTAAKRPARRNPWGSETYSDLIAKAIESYPEKQATLQQIYDYISTNYTYFRDRSDPPASAGWKNSIRHNLSLHDKFVKCPKASESSKSSYWRLNANSLNRPYVRRRTCSLDTSGSVGGNGGGPGGGNVGGKKAKSRLSSTGGVGGPNNSASAAKRASQMNSGGRGDMKSSSLYGGGNHGDDLLASLNGSDSAAAVRSHFSSLSSGIASAFSIPGGGGAGSGETLLGLKNDPVSAGLNHHLSWANSGFLSDRKLQNDELTALCKMHASESVNSSNLSLMSGGGSGGGYEFQMPRIPPSSSTRSSFSSSGIGSERGSSSFFSPQPQPPLPHPASGRYHTHQSPHGQPHPAFSHDPQQRYNSVCEASPTGGNNSSTTPSYNQLSGILTGSAECLDGGSVTSGAGDPFLREEPHHLQHQSMTHHHHQQQTHHHHHQQHHGPPPQSTSSHLHNLLMCGSTSGAGGPSGGGGCMLPGLHGAGGGSGELQNHHQHQQQGQQQLSSQDDMELRISLEIANRVKSGDMSSTMQQWAAAAASAARTVENGV